MVALNSANYQYKALKILSELRNAGINSEIWLDPNSKMEKQLKYTDSKGIRFAVIVGLDQNEAADQVILKDLSARTQETVGIADLVKKIQDTAKSA